ncbi:MAG: protein DpdJ [Pseudomonadales bacterium]
MTTTQAIEGFLRGVLDVIEQREARLLVWGLVDGRIGRDELGELIDPLLDQAYKQGIEAFYNADDVIQALAERGLLFESDDCPYPGYRSRMAETVRLAFRLRQLFPQHRGIDGWQQARTLVADFRFTRRQRRYPRRDLEPPRVVNEVTRRLEDPAVGAALQAMLDGRAEGYRLAEFQARATSRILEGLAARRSNGTLISAGTGSGKTLAFYLPAIARIGVLRIRQGSGANWVKLLAIYPRTELLRDQFAEVYAEARRLDGLLRAPGSGKIRIGALFGETPEKSAWLQQYGHQGWRETSDKQGLVCSYMTCTQRGCDGELVWRKEDIKNAREQLSCARCGHAIPPDELILTRERLRTDPPDILFTTTEMLNQRLSDTATRQLFGLRPGATRPPEMVLLDEVHTYSGNHGAQVGYLLRRWRYLVHAPITFVGLSATLQDGVRFFARLTGLGEHQVEEVTPRPRDMVAEGAEYLLALRGDPVSRASLLSSTIQGAMLMMRVMDRPNNQPSHGLYGQRVFAFTDDIDVTNRLYFGIQDAEGRSDRGEPDMARHPNGPLAVLRRTIPSASRERAGQNWSMPESIGHRLDERKQIGRTSSQDPGVARGLDLIVATASLEVGYNDPGVGCVIQHKAPREAAQFLQRKGRAGRPRGMRPWTVVVLSDYGRDRLAYQGYEHLFDPELRPRYLPFASRYIQRMQATYALIDFLAQQLGPTLANGSVWSTLARPVDMTKAYAQSERKRQAVIVDLLARLLDDPQALIELTDELQQALQLSAEEIQALLWEYPRPILGAVIPTALRRLSSNWRVGQQPVADFAINNNPLPEFVPSNLFSDLNLPEVQVILPPAWQGDEPASASMSIAQGLRTFAPGRVSRRFGVRYSRIRHWVASEDAGRTQSQLEIADFYSANRLGDWEIRDGEGSYRIPVFRPFEVRPVSPGNEIGDTSNAFLIWNSQIVASEPGIPLTVPPGNPWQDLFDSLTCFRHAEHAAVQVRRFAVGSNADIRVRHGESYRTRFEFADQGQPAAIGYALSVDAMRIGLRIPEGLWRKVCANPELERAIRTERFFDDATAATALLAVDNPFMRGWLMNVYFAALTQHALARGVGLAEADAALAAGRSEIALSEVLESLFQSPPIDDNAPEAANEEGADHLRRDLTVLLARDDVLRGLRSQAQYLWESIDASWEPLLRRRFVATVGAAALEAICDLCPEIDSSSLVVDTDPGPRAPVDLYESHDGGAEVWISETSPGGSGAMEDFLASYSQDPRRFYSLLGAQLEPNEYSHTDYQLRRLLRTVAGSDRDEDICEIVNAVRGAQSAAATDQAMSRLRMDLVARGFVLYHAFIAAVATRLIRPGSNAASDAFLHRVAQEWELEEQRLGVELDGRSIAYHWSRKDDIDQVLTSAGIPLPDLAQRLAWRFNAIYGLLWRRGREVRRIGLEPYNPFADLAAAERLLVSAYLPPAPDPVAVDNPNWREVALARLAASGITTLTAQSHQRSALADALQFFAVNPVESEYLSVYARVAAYRQVQDHVEVDLEVEEVLA